MRRSFFFIMNEKKYFANHINMNICRKNKEIDNGTQSLLLQVD